MKVDGERAIDKIQYPFMMKMLKQTTTTKKPIREEGNFFNMIKCIYEKSTGSITSMIYGNGEWFPPKTENKIMSTLMSSVQHFIGGFSHCRKERKIKAYELERKN